MIRQLPIRIRLTLWYSLVFATAMFAIGLTSLWLVHQAVDSLEQGELQQRVRSVKRFLDARPAKEDPAKLRAEITADYDVSHGNKWLQVIDENGNWLYRSSHVSDLYPTLVLPQNAPAAGHSFSYTADSVHVRAFISTITVHGIRYTVQTGLTLDKTLTVLSNFRLQLLLLTSFGLLFSSFAGYFMSRKALSPIAALASEAQRINDKNLNVRLPELQSHDEIAALSLTLNQMLARIESGYQSIRAFTANAAHELRTPVALLRAETEVALSFPREASYYRETCQRVLANSVQMTHLIDQLLVLARTDAGVEVLCFEPVNLPDLLEEVAGEWVERFADAYIHFNYEVDAPELWTDADFIALKRLLNILLENAWRYTPSGQSVTLRLKTSASLEDGRAEISVTDTGIGIADEDQRRIFERFSRLARPLHGDFSGSGLGLVLGQWIAERHQSTLRLKSSKGDGSCFSLSFRVTLSGPKQESAEPHRAFSEPHR